MGSFNTACAITGAPIIPGQKVKLFVILQGGNYKGPMIGGSICYPWDMYQFVGLPMNAEYADYNNYEIAESDNWILEGNLQLIKEKYVMNEVEEGKTIDDYNKYHDHMNIAKESLDWSNVEDMIHSDRLFMKTWRGKNLVHLMAIPLEVYNVLMENPFELWREEKVLSNCQEYVDYKWDKYKELQEERDKALADIRETFAKRLGEIVSPEGREPYTITQEWVDAHVEMIRDMRAFRDMDDRMEWLNDSYGLRDVFKCSEPSLKLLYEMEYMAYQFMSYNHVIRPAMLSGQEWDFKDHGEYLIKLGHAVQTMHFGDEEEFPIRKITKVETSYELKFSELESKVKEWFQDDRENLETELAAIKADAGDKDVFEVLIHYKSDSVYMGLLYDNLSCMNGKVLKILMKE